MCDSSCSLAMASCRIQGRTRDHFRQRKNPFPFASQLPADFISSHGIQIYWVIFILTFHFFCCYWFFFFFLSDHARRLQARATKGQSGKGMWQGAQDNSRYWPSVPFMPCSCTELHIYKRSRGFYVHTQKKKRRIKSSSRSFSSG